MKGMSTLAGPCMAGLTGDGAGDGAGARAGPVPAGAAPGVWARSPSCPRLRQPADAASAAERTRCKATVGTAFPMGQRIARNGLIDYSFAPMADDTSLSRMMAERREKAARLRQAGRDPYRNDIRPTHTCAEVRARYESTRPAPSPSPDSEGGMKPVDGEVVRLAGRAVARRGFGKTVFLPIRDGSGDLQLFLNVDHLDPADFGEVVPELDVGDQVAAEGAVFWTKRGELSLLCRRVWLLTKS